MWNTTPVEKSTPQKIALERVDSSFVQETDDGNEFPTATQPFIQAVTYTALSITIRAAFPRELSSYVIVRILENQEWKQLCRTRSHPRLDRPIYEIEKQIICYPSNYMHQKIRFDIFDGDLKGIYDGFLFATVETTVLELTKNPILLVTRATDILGNLHITSTSSSIEKVIFMENCDLESFHETFPTRKEISEANPTFDFQTLLYSMVLSVENLYYVPIGDRRKGYLTLEMLAGDADYPVEGKALRRVWLSDPIKYPFNLKTVEVRNISHATITADLHGEDVDKQKRRFVFHIHHVLKAHLKSEKNVMVRESRLVSYCSISLSNVLASIQRDDEKPFLRYFVPFHAWSNDGSDKSNNSAAALHNSGSGKHHEAAKRSSASSLSIADLEIFQYKESKSKAKKIRTWLKNILVGDASDEPAVTYIPGTGRRNNPLFDPKAYGPYAKEKRMDLSELLERMEKYSTINQISEEYSLRYENAPDEERSDDAMSKISDLESVASFVTNDQSDAGEHSELFKPDLSARHNQCQEKKRSSFGMSFDNGSNDDYSDSNEHYYPKISVKITKKDLVVCKVYRGDDNYEIELERELKRRRHEWKKIARPSFQYALEEESNLSLKIGRILDSIAKGWTMSAYLIVDLSDLAVRNLKNAAKKSKHVSTENFITEASRIVGTMQLVYDLTAPFCKNHEVKAFAGGGVLPPSGNHPAVGYCRNVGFPLIQEMLMPLKITKPTMLDTYMEMGQFVFSKLGYCSQFLYKKNDKARIANRYIGNGNKEEQLSYFDDDFNSSHHQNDDLRAYGADCIINGKFSRFSVPREEKLDPDGTLSKYLEKTGNDTWGGRDYVDEIMYRDSRHLRQGLLEAASVYAPSQEALEDNSSSSKSTKSITKNKGHSNAPRLSFVGQDIDLHEIFASLSHSNCSYNMDVEGLSRLLIEPEDPKEVKMVTWILGRCPDFHVLQKAEEILRLMSKKSGGQVALLVILAAESALHKNRWDYDSDAHPFKEFLVMFDRVLMGEDRVKLLDRRKKNGYGFDDSDQFEIYNKKSLQLYRQQHREVYIVNREDDKDDKGENSEQVIQFHMDVASPRLLVYHMLTWSEIMNRAFRRDKIEGKSHIEDPVTSTDGKKIHNTSENSGRLTRQRSASQILHNESKHQQSKKTKGSWVLHRNGRNNSFSKRRMSDWVPFLNHSSSSGEIILDSRRSITDENKQEEYVYPTTNQILHIQFPRVRCILQQCMKIFKRSIVEKIRGPLREDDRPDFMQIRELRMRFENAVSSHMRQRLKLFVHEVYSCSVEPDLLESK